MHEPREKTVSHGLCFLGIIVLAVRDKGANQALVGWLVLPPNWSLINVWMLRVASRISIATNLGVYPHPRHVLAVSRDRWIGVSDYGETTPPPTRIKKKEEEEERRSMCR